MNKYHRVLGVSEEATRAELKSAFRRLAHRYHPDISSEENAKEKFIEVVDAYRALTAEENIKNFSTFKKASGKRRVFTTPPPEEKFKPETADEVSADSSTNTSAESACDIDVYVSVEELYWGVDVKVNPSTACIGRRSQKGWRHRGLLNVKIPRGTRNGARLRITSDKSGGEAGELYLTIKLKPHTQYEIDGENLYVDMPLSVWEAEQGAVIDVITPGGRVDVDVPAGIASGQSVRIPRHGLPISRWEQGDLFAVARLVNINNRTGKLHKWPNIPHANSSRWRTVGNRHGSNVDVRV